MELTGTLTVRGPDFRRYIGICTLLELEAFMASHQVTRVDLYLNRDGTAQAGIEFLNGATTIFDVDSFTKATAWAAIHTTGHADVTRKLHYQTKGD